MAGAFLTADQERLAAFRRTAAQLASDFTTNDGVDLPGRALLVTGQV
jgi:hypothetical protein